MGQLFKKNSGNPSAGNDTDRCQHGAESESFAEQSALSFHEGPPDSGERYYEAGSGTGSGEVELPPVDEIAEDSDVSMFMAAGVSEDLRRAALRRLFRAAKFNRRDGLDVYCADYNRFEPLGDVITSDMRHGLERMAAAPDQDEAKPAGRSEHPGKAPARTLEPCPNFKDDGLPPETIALLEGICWQLRQRANEEGARPDVLLHDARLSHGLVESFSGKFARDAIQLPVISIASMGAEVFLAVLASGASRVVLLISDRSGDSESQAIEGQTAIVSAVMEGLGLGAARIGLVQSGTNAGRAAECIRDGPGRWEDTTFISQAASRRELFFQSVDRLWAHSLTKPSIVLLPPGSAFGKIDVDPSACTLCMACVGVCPSQALSSGKNLPEIYFQEGACFQCGLCLNPCPEKAIKLSARIVFGAAARGESRLMRRAERFHCVVCGEPFAAVPMVDRMIQKLAGHRFYQDETARRRLQMCADCRVRDIHSAGGIDTR